MVTAVGWVCAAPGSVAPSPAHAPWRPGWAHSHPEGCTLRLALSPPPPPSRGAGIHHRSPAPSLPSPPGSSALLPGFASFAFPRLPAPRQSDLRTQRRQRLPPRREPLLPAALAAKEGRGGASLDGEAGPGERAGEPTPTGGSGSSRKGLVRRGIRVGFEPATSGAQRRESGTWREAPGPRSCAPETESLLGIRGSPIPCFLPLAPPLERGQPYGAVAQGSLALLGAAHPPPLLPRTPSRLPSSRLVFTPFTHL